MKRYGKAAPYDGIRIFFPVQTRRLLPFQLKSRYFLVMFSSAGSIPPGWVSLLPQSLRELRLSYNRLSGALPAFILGGELQVLDLGNNYFNGTLGNWGYWPNIEELMVRHNIGSYDFPH